MPLLGFSAWWRLYSVSAIFGCEWLCWNIAMPTKSSGSLDHDGPIPNGWQLASRTLVIKLICNTQKMKFQNQLSQMKNMIVKGVDVLSSLRIDG